MNGHNSEFEQTRRSFNELAMDMAAEMASATADLDLAPIEPLTGFKLVEEEAEIPQAPSGFGVVDIAEARKALDVARNSGDVQRTLDAHHAWLDLADELPAAVQRAQADTRKLVLTAAVLALIAGLALGFGGAALLFLAVGR